MSEAIIRRAEEKDMEGIHNAHMRSIREICVKDHGEKEISGWGYREFSNKWGNSIRDHYVWVVELNNEIHGHAFIRVFEKDSEKHAYIHGLYLTPEVVGIGIGKKLINLMLEAARNEKVKIIKLESTITAHDFYKSSGFKDVGPMEMHNIGGENVSCFPMSLNLDK